MALSLNAVKRLIHALGSRTAGNEAATAIDAASNAVAQSASTIAATIVATSTSTTTDFASLKVGDKIAQIPAVAGNAMFETVVTAGTKPSAAVIGDLYLVIRALAATAARSDKL